jgi:magnesium-protoporphyrin O-methyltransferase
MHAVGKYFPAGNRAPKIVPVRETHLHFGINNNPRLEGWCIGRTKRIKSGFYQSQALEIVKR